MKHNEKNTKRKNINYLLLLLLLSFTTFLIVGCNSKANLPAWEKEYTDEEWLKMVNQPENQVKTVWRGLDAGTIDNEGQWGMSLQGLNFRNTPAGLLDSQLPGLTRRRPLLFLPMFDESDPDIVLTGIYFYYNCSINNLNSNEKDQIKAALKKALNHVDTRVRCAAIETLTRKNLLGVEEIKCGLDDEATIVRDMTASYINTIFKTPFYNGKMELDDFLVLHKQRLVQIKRELAQVLINNLNDTSFYVRQICASTICIQICSNINGESTGHRFDWVTAGWKSIIETQNQWRTWWAENGEIALNKEYSQISSDS